LEDYGAAEGDADRFPIMGGAWASNSKRSLWWNGTTPLSMTIQDDLAVLAGATNGFGYRADDVGDTPAAATNLEITNDRFSASGIITTTSDADYFALDIHFTGVIAISLNDPFGGMLDAKLELRSSDGSLIYSADSALSTTEYLSTSVTPGRYYLVVLSHGDYGDIGQYSIDGRVMPVATGLTATCISASQVALNWTDNADIESGYVVERSTDGVTWSQIATLAPDATSYIDSPLTDLIPTYYRVAAYDATGIMPYSNIASAQIQISAPTNLVASVASTSAITLRWSDNSAHELGYKVERSLDGLAWTPAVTTGPNMTSCSVTGLSFGTLYYLRVSSYNAAGTSVPANTSATTWVAMPPTNVKATVVSSTSIRLTWTDNADNETGFRIDISTDKGATWTQLPDTPGANTISYIVPNMVPGTLYAFRMRAYNTRGESPNSNTATATTTFIPPAPSNLKATAASTTQINLTWKDNSINEVGFRIERNDGTGWKLIAVAPANVSSYSNTGLTPGKSYSYRVCAYNSTSENSGYSSSITMATLPNAPTGLSAKALPGTQIQLTWTAVAGASGYLVERSLNGSTWAQVGSVSTTSFTNVGLTAGVKYYYRIRAYTSGGKGAYSLTVNLLAIA
jgi:hypothetical protein